MAKIRKSKNLSTLVAMSDAFRVVFHTPESIPGPEGLLSITLSLAGRIGDGYVGEEKWRTLVSVTLKSPCYGMQYRMVDPAEELFERITGVDKDEYLHFWA